MQIVAPDYYTSFHCIADRCQHSCCVGWEIDIDEDSLAWYQDPAHPLHEKLQENIDLSDTPHFRLGANERCPFLTQEGLCQLILTAGEDELCQICADHPRFRNYFSDRTEIGLGLCCEAACKLILEREEPTTFVVLDDDGVADEPTLEEAAFLTLRERIFAILQDRTLPMQERLTKMLTLCGASLPETTVGEWAGELRQLEQMDPAWDALLSTLVTSEKPLSLPMEPTKWDIPLEQLAVYFAFRYLADSLEVACNCNGRLAQRAGFCVRSVQFLYALFCISDGISLDTAEDMVRLYSSEIEYSEDNMGVLFENLI